MDMSLIQSTISSLKNVSDIAKSFLEMKSLAVVPGRVIEMQSAILEAQSSALEANADQAAMAEEVQRLKVEIAKLNAWQHSAAR